MKGVVKNILFAVVGFVIGGVVVGIIMQISISQQQSPVQNAPGQYTYNESEPEKSELDKKYILLAKKLEASPIDYLGKTVQLKGTFAGLSTDWLDNSRGFFFSSQDYLGFNFYGPDRYFFMWCFMKKSKGEVLYELNRDDAITISGKVVSADGDRTEVKF